MTTTPSPNHHQQRVPPPIELGSAPEARDTVGARPATGETVRSPGREAGPIPSMIELGSLKPGDEIDGVLACAGKTVVSSQRAGLTFLVVVLRDRERKIEARAFGRVHELAGQFERGDVVHVRGRVTTYNGDRQIRLEQIARHETRSGTTFLPTAYRDLDELDGYLEHLTREVSEPGYRALLDSLLSDGNLREAWRSAPCACAGHHAYLGGLLEHTVAVTTLALETCALHPRLNSDLLITAAIVHDLGLTQAFTYTAEIIDSDAGRMLGHVELGLEILREHSRRVSLPRIAWQPLAHCVLAHHGLRAVLGRTYACAEALALQRLVALDEGVKRALESGQTA